MKKFVLWLLLFLPLVLQAKQRVTLVWDANTEPDLAGYIVYYGVASGTYTNAIDVGNVTTMSVSNLLEGCTYYFVVTAYNTSGLESEPSNEVFYFAPIGGFIEPVEDFNLLETNYARRCHKPRDDVAYTGRPIITAQAGRKWSRNRTRADLCARG